MAPPSGGGGGAAPGSRPDTAYLCYLLLGAGTLFPWNALITAADYWEARFPGRHTDRLLTITYLPVNLVVITAMVHWHARVRPRLRILGGLLGFTLAISAVPLLDLAPPSSGALAAVLLLVAACGACDGFAQGALFGEAALLPPRYTQALCAGTAVSGVVVSLLRVVTKATLPDTEAGLRRSANLYFAIAALVCATCTAVYAVVLPQLPAVRQYRLAALEAALQDSEAVNGAAAEGGGAGGAVWKVPSQQQQPQYQPQYQQQPARPSLDLELSFEDHMHGQGQGQAGQARQGGTIDDQDGEAALLQGRHGGSSDEAWLHDRSGGSLQRRAHGKPETGLGSGGPRLSAVAVARCIWRLVLSNILIYVVTLSIFPGVLAEDQHSAELGSWYPVALLTLFNLADWAGKSVPGVPALRLRSERAILGATCLRALFIPAFHLAAVGGAGPAVIGLLAALLGASNGYCTTCAMCEGAAAAPPGAAELAGNIMVLSLILGLTLGAACGFLWLL